MKTHLFSFVRHMLVPNRPPGLLTRKRPRTLAAVAWLGMLFLVLCGSFTNSRAQAVDNSNDIVGAISWTNPAGQVRNFLLQSFIPPLNGHPGGFDRWHADAVGGGLHASSLGLINGTGDGATTPYGIRVQGVSSTSVVRQTDCILLSLRRPRLTFSSMSAAAAVQRMGLGSAL